MKAKQLPKPKTRKGAAIKAADKQGASLDNKTLRNSGDDRF